MGHLSSRVLEKRLRARCSPVLTGERLRLRQASCECLPMTTTQRSNPRQTPYLWSKWSPAKHSSRGAHCVRRISSAANSWTKSPEKAALEIYGGGLSFISGKCWRTRPMIVSCRSALCRHALQAGAGSAIPDASSAIGTITRYPPAARRPAGTGQPNRPSPVSIWYMNRPITVTTSRVTGPPASLPVGFPRTARIFLWATRKSARRRCYRVREENSSEGEDMASITRRSRDIQELVLIPNISRSVADRSCQKSLEWAAPAPGSPISGSSSRAVGFRRTARIFLWWPLGSVL